MSRPWCSVSRRGKNALALGQAISLLLAGTAVTSKYLSNAGVNIPTAQSSLNYFFLSLLLVYRWWAGWRPLSMSLWKYGLLALADVEANYFIVKAFQYTSITSVMLLDAFTIPFVIAISWAFMKAKFGMLHVVGVGLCCVGLTVLVFSDAIQNPNSSHSSPPAGNSTLALGCGGETLVGASHHGPSNSQTVKGDLLCILGALFYAVSNVGEEAFVKRYDITEYLGVIGAIGVVISGVQLSILERDELDTLSWSAFNVGCLLGYAACLLAMYILTAVFMRNCDSTAFNLSVLTSDGWSLLFGVVLFSQHLGWMYFVALAVVVSGIVTYHLAPSPTRHQASTEEGDKHGEGEASELVAAQEDGAVGSPLLIQQL